MVLLYVLVQIFAFMILGFGVAGGQLLIELANTGVTYSVMHSIWKEGVHLRAFEPGSRSFFIIMTVQFCVMYTEQLIRELNIKRPDPNDHENYEYTWQWIVLACYFFRYWGLFQVFTFRVMYQGHKDNSHLFRW